MSPGQRIVFTGPGEVALETFDVPSPGPDDVLVRTICTAVSAGTELTGLLGVSPGFTGYPVYPGYANVGTVEAVGNRVTVVRPGDRVLSMGHHASHALLDLSPGRTGGPAYLEPLPAGLAAEPAAFAILGSVALHGMRKAEPQVGGAAAVFGQGIVGQLLVQLAKVAGCRPVIAIDVVPERLHRSVQSGATAAVDASRDDVPVAVQAATGGRGADYVFDATRTPQTLPTMLRCAAMGGKVLIVGSAMGRVELEIFTELQLKELAIIGCYQPAAPLTAHHTFPWTQRRNRQIYLELLAAGQLRLDHLITHVVPAIDAPAIYAMVQRGGTDWLGVVFTW
jgi:2-desacetyl-2-hydroxyethyl bacteriochlorophyllide A dehydrogenase